MGLGLTGGGGESQSLRIPYIKWNAKAGRMFRTDRTNENGNWESIDTDITDTAIFQVDFDTVRTGWISFSNPIDFSHATNHGVTFGEKPGEANRDNPYKLGFIVGFSRIKISTAFGNSPATLASAIRRLKPSSLRTKSTLRRTRASSQS